MILSGASALYGAAAAWRRRWYARDASRRRRLDRPVVSVGNLSTGGRGKTPVVGELARLLLARGERPAILSRGYGRRYRPDGVTVVSDGARLLADVEHAGDEPLMLARAVPGVPVLVSGDRHLAGRLAEEQFGASVHLLDDGFQHLALERDVNLLLMSEADLGDRVLPAGRLREPIGAAGAADAILWTEGSDDARDGLRARLGGVPMFSVRRTLGAPVGVSPAGPIELTPATRVFVVAAIARPERFFEDVATAGWSVTGTQAFRDHHWFSREDAARIDRAAQAAGAGAILTTDKDAVRLEAHTLSLPLARVPLTVAFEPEGFPDWVMARIKGLRSGDVVGPTFRSGGR